MNIMEKKRPRIPGTLCAFTYKEDGETKVQLIHHNITVPFIRKDIGQFRKELKDKKRKMKNLF